jgi:hypothetical protein
MEFKTWYAVYYILKKGLKAGVITQWEKAGEIPDDIINSPDVLPRGGYIPLGMTGYICPLMAREGDKALIYNNDGKYYFVDALTERLLAFYSYVHKNTLKIAEVLLWKRVGVKSQKEIREIRNNFIKTHEKMRKTLSRSDIPIYADQDHELNLGVFAYEVRDYSTKYGMKTVRFQYTMSEKEEKRLIKMIVKSKFILWEMCDKLGISECQAKIFLHSHGINHMDKKVFSQSIWKKLWVFLLGALLFIMLLLVLGLWYNSITSSSILGVILSGMLLGVISLPIETYVKRFMVLGYTPRRKHIVNNIFLDMPSRHKLME